MSVSIYATARARDDEERRALNDLIDAVELDAEVILHLAQKAYQFKLALRAATENVERDCAAAALKDAHHLIDDLVNCHLRSAAAKLDAEAFRCGHDLRIVQSITRAYQDEEDEK